MESLTKSVSINKERPKPKNKEASRLSKFVKEISTNKYMYLLTLPGIIFFLVFSYLPMIGITIAFQNFNPVAGLMSPYVGFRNFSFFFTSLDWLRVTFNTVYLNVLFISSQLIIAVVIAVMLSEIKNKPFVKVTQSVAILPHFLSWAVVAMFSSAFFSSDNGFINITLKSLGVEPVNFNTNAGIWPTILVLIRIWKEAGFASIIYLATIIGIDSEMYEAAKIDGANKLQSILFITLPMLKNTAIILTLFATGKIFYGDFGMIYAIVQDNSLLYPTTDVIDTFVFRALRINRQVGMAAAVGLYQSLVGFILVIVSNAVAKKYDKDTAIF